MRHWRQQQILELMVEGKTNAQIAHALGIAESTVKNLNVAMYGRMNVAGRSEAVAQYLTNGERDTTGLEVAQEALTTALGIVNEALTRARGTTTE